MDMEYDYFRVEEYSLIPDSGGAGRYRGGLGFQRRYHILADDVTFATYSDRFHLAPEGLFGGADGVCASTQVLRGEQVIKLPSKTSFPLQKGDILVARTGGGAGYGKPAERAAGDIEWDLREGYMSPAGRQTAAAE